MNDGVDCSALEGLGHRRRAWPTHSCMARTRKPKKESAIYQKIRECVEVLWYVSSMRLYLMLLVSAFKFFGRSKTSSRVAEGVFLYFSEAGCLVAGA